ncbi:unnamed protein product, partial [Prorocentrum cordatum]
GRGGKQGGVESLAIFNIVLEWSASDLQASWARGNFGFQLDREGVPPISHIIWADNIYLFAATASDFKTITQELTEVQQDAAGLSIDAVEELEVLGALVSREADAHTSMEHRLAKAEGTYWSNARTLRGP